MGPIRDGEISEGLQLHMTPQGKHNRPLLPPCPRWILATGIRAGIIAKKSMRNEPVPVVDASVLSAEESPTIGRSKTRPKLNDWLPFVDGSTLTPPGGESERISMVVNFEGIERIGDECRSAGSDHAEKRGRSCRGFCCTEPTVRMLYQPDSAACAECSCCPRPGPPTVRIIAVHGPPYALRGDNAASDEAKRVDSTCTHCQLANKHGVLAVGGLPPSPEDRNCQLSTHLSPGPKLVVFCCSNTKLRPQAFPPPTPTPTPSPILHFLPQLDGHSNLSKEENPSSIFPLPSFTDTLTPCTVSVGRLSEPGENTCETQSQSEKDLRLPGPLIGSKSDTTGRVSASGGGSGRGYSCCCPKAATISTASGTSAPRCFQAKCSTSDNAYASSDRAISFTRRQISTDLKDVVSLRSYEPNSHISTVSDAEADSCSLTHQIQAIPTTSTTTTVKEDTTPGLRTNGSMGRQVKPESGLNCVGNRAVGASFKASLFVTDGGIGEQNYFVAPAGEAAAENFSSRQIPLTTVGLFSNSGQELTAGGDSDRVLDLPVFHVRADAPRYRGGVVSQNNKSSSPGCCSCCSRSPHAGLHAQAWFLPDGVVFRVSPARSMDAVSVGNGISSDADNKLNHPMESTSPDVECRFAEGEASSQKPVRRSVFPTLAREQIQPSQATAGTRPVTGHALDAAGISRTPVEAPSESKLPSVTASVRQQEVPRDDSIAPTETSLASYQSEPTTGSITPRILTSGSCGVRKDSCCTSVLENRMQIDSSLTAAMASPHGPSTGRGADSRAGNGVDEGTMHSPQFSSAPPFSTGALPVDPKAAASLWFDYLAGLSTWHFGFTSTRLPNSMGGNGAYMAMIGSNVAIQPHGSGPQNEEGYPDRVIDNHEASTPGKTERIKAEQRKGTLLPRMLRRPTRPRVRTAPDRIVGEPPDRSPPGLVGREGAPAVSPTVAQFDTEPKLPNSRKEKTSVGSKDTRQSRLDRHLTLKTMQTRLRALQTGVLNARGRNTLFGGNTWRHPLDVPPCDACLNQVAAKEGLKIISPETIPIISSHELLAQQQAAGGDDGGVPVSRERKSRQLFKRIGSPQALSSEFILGRPKVVDMLRDYPLTVQLLQGKEKFDQLLEHTEREQYLRSGISDTDSKDLPEAAKMAAMCVPAAEFIERVYVGFRKERRVDKSLSEESGGPQSLSIDDLLVDPDGRRRLSALKIHELATAVTHYDSQFKCHEMQLALLPALGTFLLTLSMSFTRMSVQRLLKMYQATRVVLGAPSTELIPFGTLLEIVGRGGTDLPQTMAVRAQAERRPSRGRAVISKAEGVVTRLCRPPGWMSCGCSDVFAEENLDEKMVLESRVRSQQYRQSGMAARLLPVGREDRSSGILPTVEEDKKAAFNQTTRGLSRTRPSNHINRVGLGRGPSPELVVPEYNVPAPGDTEVPRLLEDEGPLGDRRTAKLMSIEEYADQRPGGLHRSSTIEILTQSPAKISPSLPGDQGLSPPCLLKEVSTSVADSALAEEARLGRDIGGVGRLFSSGLRSRIIGRSPDRTTLQSPARFRTVREYYETGDLESGASRRTSAATRLKDKFWRRLSSLTSQIDVTARLTVVGPDLLFFLDEVEKLRCGHFEGFEEEALGAENLGESSNLVDWCRCVSLYMDGMESPMVLVAKSPRQAARLLQAFCLSFYFLRRQVLPVELAPEIQAAFLHTLTANAPLRPSAQETFSTIQPSPRLPTPRL